VSRNVDVIFYQRFCKFNRYSSCLTIFLVLELNLIFQRSCLFKSNCWMKSGRCPFLFFFNFKLLRLKIQHTLFNVVLWLSYILKTEMSHCKIKMTFFMVLCVSFNLWSWIYLLIICDEVTFYEFQETKDSSQNLRIHQEKLFSFLAPILSTCIIISSLIHEVTTLMEQLFKFWDRHLSVQIAYLIKKGF